jgi:hypothetical protein
VVSELGGSQISSLLETLPGIANVLRSPVADAIVGALRAGAGLAEFRIDDADELVKFAVRRGLMNGDEGDRLLAELRAVAEPGSPKPARPAERKPSPPPAAAAPPVRPSPQAAKAAPTKAPPKPVKATKPVKTAKPVRPAARTAKPAKPVRKSKPAKPVKAKPVKASRSARPVKSVKPVKKAAKSGRKR